MRIISLFLTSSLLSISGSAAAQTAQTQGTQASPPTTEQRASMAKAHEQFAACLRSDKPMDTCRDEMMKTCGQQTAGCPMMGYQGQHMKGKSTTGR